MFTVERGILGYLLRKASSSYTKKMDEALNEYGITAPQFIIMSIITNFPGCSNADLARLALLTPQTVNSILSRLDKMNLIERVEHPYYKRIQQIELSKVGSTLFKSCDAVINDLDLTLENGFSSDEITIIRRWLGKAIENAYN